MAPDSVGKESLGRIVVFGFGSQGRAQAANLRDTGLNVSVFVRETSSRVSSARESGIAVITDPREAASRAECAVVLIPDSEQPRFYKEALEPHLPKGAMLVFAHGFAIHYQGIVPRPDLDCVLAAPLSHADALRSEFIKLRGVPCVVAVAQDATGRARAKTEAYAHAICGAGPFIRSTFAEEVETDLFAEQAVLCGGMPELVRAAFDTLVEAGYNKEIAYVSCLRELRAIVDLMSRGAIAGMLGSVSDTARYGAITRGPRVIGAPVREELKKVLTEIRSGQFAEELAREKEAGFARLASLMRDATGHEIEDVHEGFGSKGER